MPRSHRPRPPPPAWLVEKFRHRSAGYFLNVPVYTSVQMLLFVAAAFLIWLGVATVAAYQMRHQMLWGFAF